MTPNREPPPGMQGNRKPSEDASPNVPRAWVYRFIPEYFDIDRCEAQLGWMDVPLPNKSVLPNPGDLFLLATPDGVARAVVEVERYLGKVRAPHETRPFWTNRDYKKGVFPRVRVRFVSRSRVAECIFGDTELARLQKTPWFRISRLASSSQIPALDDASSRVAQCSTGPIDSSDDDRGNNSTGNPPQLGDPTSVTGSHLSTPAEGAPPKRGPGRPRKVGFSSPPETKGFREQQSLSLDATAVWWRECLTQGRIVGNTFSAEWPTKPIGKESLREARNAYARTLNVKRDRVLGTSKLTRDLRTLCPAIETRQKTSERAPAYRLPTLETARRQWDERFPIRTSDVLHVSTPAEGVPPSAQSETASIIGEGEGQLSIPGKSGVDVPSIADPGSSTEQATPIQEVVALDRPGRKDASQMMVKSWGPAERHLVLGLTVPEYMRVIRAKANLTQKEFAAKLEVTQPVVSSWEREASLPSEEDWIVIQRQFGEVSLAQAPADETVSVTVNDRCRQCRALLEHLVLYGELTTRELRWLDIAPTVLDAWANSLLMARPGNVYVVTPLFLDLVQGSTEPGVFTSRLALRFLGDHANDSESTSLDVEAHVWERLESWNLPWWRTDTQDEYQYLCVPTVQDASRQASERLDLFAKLPPEEIRRLLENLEFVSDQSKWSAQVSGRSEPGTLSRQMRARVQRPLFLPRFRVPEGREKQVFLRDLRFSEVISRRYVVAGVPICTAEEWEKGVLLDRGSLSERLLNHPLYRVIVQFEVHRLFAGLNAQVFADLRSVANEGCIVEIEGADAGPLWKICRAILSDLNYRPVGQSVSDSLWSTAVQVALDNLVALEVLHETGGMYRITENFSSTFKSYPTGSQNRGEKLFRVRLLQHLEGLHGGSR